MTRHSPPESYLKSGSTESLITLPTMELLTAALLEKFAETGRQNIQEDPLVICKFFHIAYPLTWYATEYDLDRECFFGYVDGGDFPEWGRFTLKQLQSIEVMGLTMERDITFEPSRFSEAVGTKAKGPREPGRPRIK